MHWSHFLKNVRSVLESFYKNGKAYLKNHFFNVQNVQNAVGTGWAHIKCKEFRVMDSLPSTQWKNVTNTLRLEITLNIYHYYISYTLKM